MRVSSTTTGRCVIVCGVVCCCWPLASASGQPREPARCILPEQRRIAYRRPDELPPRPSWAGPTPPTVTDSRDEVTNYFLSLDEAIQIALSNAEVIRILSGATARSTGQTIYDPAITNTQVDQARARFDPFLRFDNDYQHNENPFFRGTGVEGLDVESYNLGTSLNQRKPGGGETGLRFTTNPTWRGDPTEFYKPRTPSSLDFTLTQPLLRDRGRDVNLAPIVIARIDTERSVYQLKDTVQELVRSVIEGYWGLVFARTDVWARRQQVEQLQFAFDYLDAQRRVGRANLGDTAQAQVSLANFRANLIATEASLLDREMAFLNALGLPPNLPLRLVPTTTPQRDPLPTSWEELVALAEQNRPDLIESRLALEADRQRLLVAGNNTLPKLDAEGGYAVNGLAGRTPTGDRVANNFWQFNDLRVGLSLELPVGQRDARANLRREQLTLARDQALLRQQIHAMQHDVAANLRNLDSLFAQFEAFRKVRTASRFNLDRQFAVFREGGVPTERSTAVEVLLAVTDWGNAVSSEAQTLTLYNSQIAALDQQVGVILEKHGIVFQEDQYRSMGPTIDRHRGVCYPERTPVGPNAPRYPVGHEPAEESFDLESLVPDLTRPLDLPPRPDLRPLPPVEPLPAFPAPDRSSPPPSPPPAQPATPPAAQPLEPSPPPVETPSILDRIKELLPGGGEPRGTSPPG